MEGNSEGNYKHATEDDDRLLILILVASFIIISMIIIIGSTACILLCFEESIEEKEEEIQEMMSKLTEKKSKKKATASTAGSQMPGSKKPGDNRDNSYVIPVPTAPVAPNCQQNNSVAGADKQECLSNKVSDKYKTDNNPVSANGSSSGLAGNSSIAVGDRWVSSNRSSVIEGCDSKHKQQSCLNNGFRSENCLLEQLRVSDNWKHLMAVERGGQIKLNLREQLSAQL